MCNSLTFLKRHTLLLHYVLDNRYVRFSACVVGVGWIGVAPASLFFIQPEANTDGSGGEPNHVAQASHLSVINQLTVFLKLGKPGWQLLYIADGLIDFF